MSTSQSSNWCPIFAGLFHAREVSGGVPHSHYVVLTGSSAPSGCRSIQVPTAEEVCKIHDESVRIMSITMPYALKQVQATVTSG